MTSATSSTRARGDRRWNALADAALALSGILLAGVAAILLLGPPPWLTASLVGDDAGYYLRLALNLRMGRGATFDGVTPTTGFNPLQLLLTSAVLAPVPSPDTASCWRAGLAVSLAAVLATPFPLAAAARRVLGTSPGLGTGARRLVVATVVLLFAGFPALKGMYGIDAPLVLFLGAIYAWHAARHGVVPSGAAAAARSGLLLGLLILARVDSVALVAAAGVTMAAIAGTDVARWRSVAVAGAVAAAVTAPYVAWLRLTSGHWLPISAALKTDLATVHVAEGLRLWATSSLHPADAVLFAATAVLSAGALVALGRRGLGALRDDAVDATLVVLALYGAGRVAFTLCFARMEVQTAHLILLHLVWPLLLLRGLRAVAASAARPRGADGAAAVLALALVVLTGVLVAGKTAAVARRLDAAGSGGQTTTPEFAARVRAATGDEDVLFGGGFGLAGFFADRRWINADGVVNTWEYQRALAGPEGLRRVLDDAGVTHVVGFAGPGASGPFQIRVTGALSGRAHTLDVPRERVILTTRLADRDGVEVFLARYP